MGQQYLSEPVQENHNHAPDVAGFCQNRTTVLVVGAANSEYCEVATKLFLKSASDKEVRWL